MLAPARPSSLRSLAALLLCLSSLPAFAQATRTWVSGVGDDVNPCSRTAPCKTFAGAISKTAAGGEIDVLDPGGYGGVTITKGITIDGHNTMSSILATGVNGVVISAAATDVVILRGLSINGAGSGLTGVTVNTAGGVHVEDCRIAGFNKAGISVASTAASTLQLHVTNTVISDVVTGINTGSSTPTAVAIGAGTATLEHVQLKASLRGVFVDGAAKATVSSSLVSGNSTVGVQAASTSEVNLERSVVSGNGIGIQGDSTVRVSDTMVSHNTTGMTGSVLSFQNNRLAAGNATTGTPAGTLSQQ